MFGLTCKCCWWDRQLFPFPLLSLLPRAPFPIFIHIYWLKAEDNTAQLKEFIGGLARRQGACADVAGGTEPAASVHAST